VFESHSKTLQTHAEPLTPSATQIITNLGQKSGLEDIAHELNVKRTGQSHQAGSDSLLTGKIFWEMRKHVFAGSIDEDKYLGQVWGLGKENQHQATKSAEQRQLNGAAGIYQNGNPPQTPQTGHVGLAGTPGAQQPVTPGASGGAFGSFLNFGGSRPRGTEEVK
jgi:CCR4-NOT transcription complex subunit 7/8